MFNQAHDGTTDPGRTMNNDKILTALATTVLLAISGVAAGGAQAATDTRIDAPAPSEESTNVVDSTSEASKPAIGVNFEPEQPLSPVSQQNAVRKAAVAWDLSLRGRSVVGAAAHSAVKIIATPFMQYRSPVGCGPSLNTWPRWLPHRLHRTSVRVMSSRLVSGRSSTALSRVFQKLGHPVPLSNLVSEE